MSASHASCVRIATILLVVGLLALGYVPAGVPANTRTDLYPKWSPDGTSIAFNRADVVQLVDRNGRRLRRAEDARYGWDFAHWFDWLPGSNVLGILHHTIFTTDGRFTRTTPTAWWCPSPAFSQQGLLVAYPSHVPSDDCVNARFTVATLDGSTVLETMGLAPSFSPDGRYVAFHRRTHNVSTSRYDEHSTYVADLRTLEIAKVLDAGVSVTWAPNSRRLAVLDWEPSRGPGTGTDGVLYLLDPDGRSVVRVGQVEPNPAAIGPEVVSWTPDGRWLAYTSPKGARIVRPGGAVSRTLGRGFVAGWSPGRPELLVTSRGRVDVLQMSGRRRSIASGTFPSWAPDGSQIVYVGNNQCGPRQGIWTVSPSGMHRRRLTNACTRPGWVGRDRVRGTRWRDSVHTYESNDVVLVRGGGLDSVSCGDGLDTVEADRSDRIADDCERVTKLPR
jgi:Tol biopolymer transport system component